MRYSSSLLLVAAAELAVDGAGVVEDEVEDRTAAAAWRCLSDAPALARRARAEEALEDEPRVGLGRHRRRGRLPGEVVLVGAGVARVAVARLADRVAGQLQRGEAA